MALCTAYADGSAVPLGQGLGATLHPVPPSRLPGDGPSDSTAAAFSAESCCGFCGVGGGGWGIRGQVGGIRGGNDPQVAVGLWTSWVWVWGCGGWDVSMKQGICDGLAKKLAIFDFFLLRVLIVGPRYGFTEATVVLRTG